MDWYSRNVLSWRLCNTMDAGSALSADCFAIACRSTGSLDFTSDALANGRKFRTANLKDDCTPKCPAIEIDFSLPGERVIEMLERVARERGYTDILVVDNGPELRGRALDGWAGDHGVQLYFIDPGNPTENAYIVSFNGRYRAKFLNQHWFSTAFRV